MLSTYAQFGWFDKHKQNFYIYTPSTDTAINITSSTAVVNGSNSRVKSIKTDTLATKLPIQNWIVLVGVDSVPGKITRFTGLTQNTSYSFYHSILVHATDGDWDWYKGETKTFYIPDYPAGLYITTLEGKYWITSEGKFITIREL